MLLTNGLIGNAQGTTYHEPTKLRVKDTYLNATGQLVVLAEREPPPGDSNLPAQNGALTIARQPVWFQVDLPKLSKLNDYPFTQSIFRPGSPDVAKLRQGGFGQVPFYESPVDPQARARNYVSVDYSSKPVVTPSFPEGVGVDPRFLVAYGQDGQGVSGVATFSIGTYDRKFRDDGHPVLYVLLPVTVALDVAFFPFEAVLMGVALSE